jgi:hypothetical protein
VRRAGRRPFATLALVAAVVMTPTAAGAQDLDASRPTGAASTSTTEPTSSAGEHSPTPNGRGGDFASAAAAEYCSIFAQKPYKNVSQTRIYGVGDQSCQGLVSQTMTVKVQQYRGLGVWRDKVTKTQSSTNSMFTVKTSWYCASGTGNQLYRTFVTGSARYLSGRFSSGSVRSEEYRTTCPA